MREKSKEEEKEISRFNINLFILTQFGAFAFHEIVMRNKTKTCIDVGKT